MIPKNEQEVIYLFSRNHEKLGFEKIKYFDPHNTPDCVALKNGKEIGIEFEYKLKMFCRHYAKEVFSPRKMYDHKIIGKYLLIYRRDTPNKIIARYLAADYQIWDPKTFPISPSILIDNYSSSGSTPLVVIFKTLSQKIPYIVCWEKDFELNDNIEIIELKNLNLS